MPDLDNTALLVIDVQRAFDDDDYWGQRNNPDCEANVAALIAAWREAGTAARVRAARLGRARFAAGPRRAG